MFFASKWAVTAVAALALVVGTYASGQTHNAMWLARSGAIVVAMGVFLMANAQLNGVDIADVWDDNFEYKIDDPKYYLSLGEPIPDWVAKHQSARLALEVLGPTVTLVGTVIWGFGDLMPF